MRSGMWCSALGLFLTLGCTGWFTSGGSGEDVSAEIDEIEATVFKSFEDSDPRLFETKGGGAPTVASGNGVQVVHVAPLGAGTRPLQAAVVFDRPMVALSDLDTMVDAVPLTCGEVPGKARWAGTTTAVYLPEGGSFPLATDVRCAVPAGTVAVDGVALEQEVWWSFETQRPQLAASSPSHGARGIDPSSPIDLSFNHPVTVAAITPHLSLTRQGVPVPVEISQGDEPDQIVVRAELDKASTYVLTLTEGIVGGLGPLPTASSTTIQFETYGPLEVQAFGPTGTASPHAEIGLRFSTPVSGESVAENLQIEPKPEGWAVRGGSWSSRSWYDRWPLEPRTEYTVTLGGGLTDDYGQALGESRSISFVTGDYDPSFRMPTGLQIVPKHMAQTLPLQHLNCDSVKAWVGGTDLTGALRESEGNATTTVDGMGPRMQPIPIEAKDEPNVWEEVQIDLTQHNQNGLVAVRAQCSNIRGYDGNIRDFDALMVLAEFGVTIKITPTELQAWVTSLETGQPEPGIEVGFYRGRAELGVATSDASGIARLQGGPGPNWSEWSDRILAVARKGEAVGLTYHDWNDGIEPWRSNLWSDFDADAQDLTSWGFTDRGIYKPGDPVYARVYWRTEHAEGLSDPGPGTVKWLLSDPQGTEHAGGTIEVASGDVSVEVELPSDGVLGDWDLRVEGVFGKELTARTWLTIPAKAYRAPAFRVSAHGPEQALAETEAEVHVDARYLFGSPLSGGEVTWHAWVEETEFNPEGWDGWWFGPERHWWWESSDELDRHHQSETASLAESTSWSLQMPAVDRASSVQIEAVVEDVDRQEVAGRTSIPLAPAEAYVGLKVEERLPRAGEPTEVSVVALTAEGEGAPSDGLTLEVIHRSWNSVRQKGVDGRWEWVTNTDETVVHDEALRVGGSAVITEWTPAEAGTYIVRASRTDTAGRTAVAEDRVYAVGGNASWGLDEDQMLRLVPEEPMWDVGDRARILVQSPVPGLKALVTVEREGVLWQEVTELTSTATTLEIPIEDAWIPGVVVSVVAVEGAPPDGSPDAGQPQVRVGYTRLNVDPASHRYEVAIQTDQEEYRPRDTVAVTLDVTNALGAAAAGVGVTLYAVDEAVLMLTDYETPDPLTGLIRERGLSVFTGDSRTRVVDRASYLTKGAADGGGGGEESSGNSVRDRFVTTVAWQPDLKTDENGRVTTRFELPDNLTAFRLMAVAVTGDHMGSADREIRVSRPLIARPALPRRMRVDDVSFTGVVVHNNTDSDRLVEVSAQADGPVEVAGSPVEVLVEAHGAMEVPFRLRATGVGEASFRFDVHSGEDRDSVAHTLAVEQEITLEVVATAGSTTDRAVEELGVPKASRTDVGGLTVDVGTSALAGAGSGLDYLLEYPHGCVEQTTSRGLGALVALGVRDHAGIAIDEEGLRQTVTLALAGLPQYRASRSGGLGYWKGAYYGSAMGTAYAVELMGRAKEAGFGVDEQLLDDSVRYLRRVLDGKETRGWNALTALNARAYVAVALARAGHGDAGQNSLLFSKRDNLSIASTAHVLEAIARTTGPSDRTRALAQIIESRAYVDAASASIKENEGNRWARLWGSDDLSTAAALEALLVAQETHPLAPKFALHLASSKTSGRWANTRATAGVLAALARYADHYESGPDKRSVQLTLAGGSLLDVELGIPESTQAVVSLADLKPGGLTLTTENGRVYYQARLAYPPTEVVPRDEGFTVTRHVEIVDGAGPDGQVQAGATLGITLRVVTPVVRHDVAVVDPLPAGFEALDSSLATTSRAPAAPQDDEEGTTELPAFGGSWVFDHHQVDDIEVRLYADYMPPGVHTFRYAVRATSPGHFAWPPASAEAMYQPEIFGRTEGKTLSIGRDAPVAQQ